MIKKQQNPTDFFNKIYHDNDIRIIGKRNIENDLKQYKINEDLIDTENQLIEKYYSENYPLIFIVGVPRSGTTLISQLLISSLDVSYFSNLIAPYYMAPIYALSHLQNETYSQNIELKSSFGNTDSLTSPSEFGYFWQYWMDHDSNDDLTNDEMENINWEGLRKQLYAYSGFSKKKLIVKNIVYHNFKIPRLAAEFPDSLFINITRKPEFVIQSILESRIKRYGNIKHWWSIRPSIINELKKRDPVEQVVSQYFYTAKKIKNGLSEIPENRVFNLDYESLVENPGLKLNALTRFIKLESKTCNVPQITSTNNWRIDNKIQTSIKQLINKGELF